jgi:sialic acid synthase SpsE
MIIFDFSCGNSCKNDLNTAREMVIKLSELNVPGAVIKWQLFQEAGDNVPLNHDVFSEASRYANMMGLMTTASVFDEYSLDYLLSFNVPFIKLANNPKAHALLDKIPEKMRVIISTDNPDYKTTRKNTDILYCVSKYPADKKDYEKFGDKLKKGLSDHTTGWELFNKYQPEIYECHFKLDKTTGLDAGAFARTPDRIKEILINKNTVMDEILKTI